MSTKKLVIYSTNSGGKTIDHNATTWRELQEVLTKNGVSHAGMKAVDNNKMTLENPDASLSDNMTNLFLYPMKTKSGVDASGFSFSECRAFIKSALESNEDAAKAHFNVDKNYTNKSTADLKTLISSYSAPTTSFPSSQGQATQSKAESSKSTTVGKAKVKATEKLADVVNSVAKAKEAPATKEVAVSVPPMSLETAVDAIVKAIEVLDAKDSLKKEAIHAILRLKPKAKEEVDNDELARQFREIGSGIPGIRIR